jgi:hypothetical protein
MEYCLKSVLVLWGQDGSVGMETGCGLGVQFSSPARAKNVPPPYHPDRLWGPPGLLFNWYRGLFSWGMKLTIHHPVRRSRMAEIYLHSPIRLHGTDINQLIRRAILQYMSMCHSHIPYNLSPQFEHIAGRTKFNTDDGGRIFLRNISIRPLPKLYGVTTHNTTIHIKGGLSPREQ